MLSRLYARWHPRLSVRLGYQQLHPRPDDLRSSKIHAEGSENGAILDFDGGITLDGLTLTVAPEVECPRAYVVRFLYRQLAK